MGYTTTFKGRIEINNKLTDELTDYINRFSKTRHMKRDLSLISKEHVEKYGFKGMAGKEGEYLAEILGYGLEEEEFSYTIINYNQQPDTQPGLWCKWIIVDNRYIEWSGAEKFYDAEKWMQYIINNFLKPFGYICNGTIKAKGEERGDTWTLIVENNIVIRMDKDGVYYNI